MQKKRIFYGWWIVLAASIIHFWGAGIFFYSFTAFFNPLVEEFHWSYAATSFAMSFRSLESGIAAPAVGFLTDRYGARKLILIGAVLAGVACMLMSLINSLWAFYATFVFLSIGSSMMHSLPGWTAVANWFSRRRGTAMGILVAVVGFSGILIPFINWLITQYGWRATFIITGVGMWVIGIPLALVVRHSPEKYGYLPDGDEPSDREVKATPSLSQSRPAEDESSISVRQVTKMPAFWMICIVSTCSSVALNAVIVHIMPFLISVQFPRDVASTIAAAVVISSVIGRMGFGWLGDRMDKRYLLASALLMQVLGLAMLAYTTSVTQAIIFLLLFGPGYGGVLTLRLALQGDLFGRKAFGSIQGLTQAALMAGNIFSPVFAGWIYDVRGSYQWAWLILTAVVLVSVPAALGIKRRGE